MHSHSEKKGGNFEKKSRKFQMTQNTLVSKIPREKHLYKGSIRGVFNHI